MKAHFAAQPRELLRDRLRNPVDGRFVVAGRFDFDQLADGRDDLVAALAEIGKTTLRFGTRLSRVKLLRNIAPDVTSRLSLIRPIQLLHRPRQDLVRSSLGNNWQQQAEVFVELDEWGGAAFVGFQTHGDGFGAVVFALDRGVRRSDRTSPSTFGGRSVA